MNREPDLVLPGDGNWAACSMWIEENVVEATCNFNGGKKEIGYYNFQGNKFNTCAELLDYIAGGKYDKFTPISRWKETVINYLADKALLEEE